ncbi:hypothetical protein QRX60_42110 [Amycolatopsis mongoliensis]|uniref:Uncharacterized protein n=1 Tax=Amycolatopsis mongoliensis TaxID=715475 RepID=A0A9Y2NIC2_9PSEU|nr:hypothetical protein [Amycolatopsis sp. 4-36]WIY00588.1 hypothetical protein QRX60_42110 [Amycolatopsis sp. 4-36]
MEPEPESEPDEHRVCFERTLVPAGWQIDFENAGDYQLDGTYAQPR